MNRLLLAVPVVLIALAFSQSEARADEHLPEQLIDKQISRFFSLGGYTVLGQGGVSCGKWLDGRSQFAGKTTVAAVEGSAFLAYQTRETWVAGYVSAFNAWVQWPFHVTKRMSSRNIAEGTDAKSMWAWIDNWCRESPLKKLASATEQLIWHLRDRQDF